MSRLAAAAVAVLSLQGLAGAQGPRSLPDSDVFLDAVRQNLTRSQEAQRQFSYHERRTELNFNPFGRLGTGGTRTFEYTPAADGMGFDRRLLERDGQRVPDAPAERVGRRMSRGRAIVDDVAATLDVKIDRRDMLDGREAIVAVFMPKANAKPTTREGRIAKAFKGSIWIDEESKEVARIEATAIDDISFGYGLLARLNEGSSVTVRRQHIEQGIWLPVSIRFTGEGRALLLRKLVVNYALDWFDYRRMK